MSAPEVKATIEDAEVFEETINDALARLAALSPLEYEHARKDEAERLDVRISVLDVEVRRARRGHGDRAGSLPEFLADPTPWPASVDGGELLDRLTTAFNSHLVLPQGAAEAMALWTVFTHAHDCFDISTILAVTSPTPECGKTILMTMLGAFAPRALAASNITPAALFRSMDKWRPTLLIDEADTFLPGNEDLRGVLNSGHYRAGAFVLRVVGDEHEPTRFSTWGPKAVALIGRLPATLASRSIPIELRRMTAAETVVPLRMDRLSDFEPLKSQAARWAADNSKLLRAADPMMPAGLYGRSADNWRSFLAIADLAGGVWPKRARQVAEQLGGRGNEQVAGVLLLEDVRGILVDFDEGKIFSDQLVDRLIAMEERPWSEWHQAKPITKAQLAKLFAPFGIRPKTIRTGSRTAKGYKREFFDDAFARYLVPEGVTPSQSAESEGPGTKPARHNGCDVTDIARPNPGETAVCDGVTVETEERWEEIVS